MHINRLAHLLNDPDPSLKQPRLPSVNAAIRGAARPNTYIAGIVIASSASVSARRSLSGGSFIEYQRRAFDRLTALLNITKMRQESQCLLGQHDFRSFQASDPQRAEAITVRKIKQLKIKRADDYIHVDIEADGFLYKMVRNIVGTLLKAGRGRLPIGAIKRILEQKDRTQAFETAKASGLCLLEVKY